VKNLFVNIYLETSALNYIKELTKDSSGAQATRLVQDAKGQRFFISPVTLWEIMMIGDEGEREAMIDYCATLCQELLPKSPGELLIDFIKSDCKRNVYESDEAFRCKGGIASIWRAVCRKPGTSIDFDYDAFSEFTTQLKSLSKRVDKLLHTFIFTGEFDSGDNGLNTVVNIAYGALGEHMPAPEGVYAKYVVPIRKIQIALVYLVLCCEQDIAHEPIKQFWSELGVDKQLLRLDHLIKNVPYVFNSGPMEVVANVISFQMHEQKGKANRGAIHDGLHAIYLLFFDIFLTNDELLAKLPAVAKEEWKGFYGCIRKISELDFQLRRIDDLPPRTSLKL
jgi:hypothetical protein